MKRPIRHRNARLARTIVGEREGAPYTPPANLPPRPPWLKLGVRVALLTPVSEKCASGALATAYEIRPTADGETWEVACTLGDGRGAGRRFRLHNPQEFVLWQEAH